MNSTTLIYLEHNDLISCSATVAAINNDNEKLSLVLDQTVFYPQGGGQPCDTGIIASETGTFNVTSVRFLDGIVYHFGTFEHGAFQIGANVTCKVNQTRRELHSRIHSAGHIIDMAVAQRGCNWVAGKGFHFPEGPYIEYITDASALSAEALLKELEELSNQLIELDHPVTFLFMDKSELHMVCHNVPQHVPEDKPTRVVMFGNFGVPCGGTHVKKLSDVKKITIRKIKLDQKNNTLKISYDVSRDF